MPNWKEQVQQALAEYLAKNPPIIGGGRRTLIIPEPRPEDERPRYKAEGPVPDGFVRAEVCKAKYPDDRAGSFWIHVKHQDNPNPVLERVFTGDVIDIPEAEFAKLYEKNWVREPWTPKQNAKKPQAA